MQKNTLKPRHKRPASRQIGRGGSRGKTSGRGHKGQKARAGHRIRPEVRDFIKSIPKLRGHSAPRIPKRDVIPVNLSLIEKHFSAGEVVSPETLLEKKLVRMKKGSSAIVKILGTGSLSKKVTVSGCLASSGAIAAIEKAGGSVEKERTAAKGKDKKVAEGTDA